MRGVRAALVTLLMVVPALADEGKLERVRKEVRAEKAADSTPADERAKGEHLDVADPDEGVFFWFYLGCLHESFACPAFFAPYPYAYGHAGYLQPDRQLLSSDASSVEFAKAMPHCRTWAARVSVEEGNDFNGLNRVGGQIVLDTLSHFGFQSSWNVYHEQLAGGHTDKLFLGDANIFLRLLSLETFQDRVGVGVRYLTEEGRADFGVNVLYAQDWFPVRPVVFSQALEFGTLGDAGVFHYRATLGCVWSHVEVFAGYDALRIGSVWLDGPLVGCRVWF